MKRLAVLMTLLAPTALHAQETTTVQIPPVVAQIPTAICAERCLTPIEAVTFASQLGKNGGVASDFGMTVKAVGFQQGRFFLNSELDYRDRNCLTVVVPAAVMAKLAGTNDLEAVKKHYVGTRIGVRGVAQQVRVDFFVAGKVTGKYYYQIHLQVFTPRNLINLPNESIS